MQRTDDPMIGRKAALVYVPFLLGCAQGAVRFAVVPAVAEAAASEKGAEFAKGMFDFVAVEVAKAELLQAGRVDQVAFGVQMVKAGMGCGVLAGVEGSRDLPGGSAGLRYKSIDQGGFAHAGLADEDAGLALKEGAQVLGVVAGAQLENRIAKAGEYRQTLPGGWQAVGEIALVEDDEGGNILALRGSQSPCNELVGETGLGGHDENHLAHIGGDEFLANFVRAVKQATTRGDRFNYTLAGGGQLEIHQVAAGYLALLAPWKTGNCPAIAAFDDILSAMGGDDATSLAHARLIPSTIAAAVKSRGLRPPMSWEV